jgi:hypothetical protein
MYSVFLFLSCTTNLALIFTCVHGPSMPREREESEEKREWPGWHVCTHMTLFSNHVSKERKWERKAGAWWAHAAEVHASTQARTSPGHMHVLHLLTALLLPYLAPSLVPSSPWDTHTGRACASPFFSATLAHGSSIPRWISCTSPSLPEPTRRPYPHSPSLTRRGDHLWSPCMSARARPRWPPHTLALVDLDEGAGTVACSRASETNAPPTSPLRKMPNRRIPRVCATDGLVSGRIWA